MKLWDKKYNEKIKKGYEDKTEIFLELAESTDYKEDGGDLIFSDVPKEVLDFVTLLQNYANETIKQNYTVTTNRVTNKQIEEAQKLITDLANYTLVRPFIYQDFNEILLNIYKTLPRRMGNVKDFLLNENTKKDSMEHLVEAEQDLLDSLRGQVQTLSKTNIQKEKTVKGSKQSFEETFGLVIKPATVEDIKIIKKMMGPNSSQFVRAFQVMNKTTEANAAEWYKNAEAKFKKDPNWVDRKLYWHGSRNESWWSIVNNGLKLYPAKAIITGKMFGYGFYTSSCCQKSIGYTSLNSSYWAKGKDSRAFLGIYELSHGRVKKVRNHKSEYCSLTEEKLKKEGFETFHCDSGADLRNPETIIYNEKQCTIRFLVEIK